MPRFCLPCACMLRRYLPAFILILAALTLPTVFAQTEQPDPLSAPTATPEPGTITIVKTADVRLFEEEVREVMEPLAARGVRVAAYLVQSGDGDDFLDRLEADGLGNGRFADDDVIAIYVAIDERYAEIRWGEDYDTILAPLNLRREVMNPQLRDAVFTRAFVETFIAIDAALAAGPPPTPTVRPTSRAIFGVTVQPSTTTTTARAQEEDSGLGGFLLLIAMLAVFPVLFIYCVISGNCQGSSDDSGWTSTSSSGSSWSDSGGGGGSSSDSGGGGSDGGSWDD